MHEPTTVTLLEHDEEDRSEGARWAGAFLAGFKSIETRRAYRRDLECWFTFCTAHQLHPFRGVRRTHLELYLRELERQEAPPAPGTLYRRVATLSSWFRWLEDEDVTIGNPAARIRRPQRHSRPQPWLNRNELTDLLTAAEDDGGGYQPTLRILGKGDKPAEVVLNPRTQQAVDQAVADRPAGPLLRNQWRHRMQPHNAAALLRRLAAVAGITQRITPHALRRSYITIGLLPGVPLRDMQRAARHAKADTTVAYDQWERSFHKDPTFVLMAATAR